MKTRRLIGIFAAICFAWCAAILSVTPTHAADDNPDAGQTDVGSGIGAGGGGALDQARDSFSEAIRGLLNPLPDREGPCPGGRQVVDKFGRKRCVNDSNQKSGSGDAPPVSAEGSVGKEPADKGLYESIADTLTDAMRALFNPLPDRDGPCPGGREVVDKFGRKRCVTDSDQKEGTEQSRPSEGGGTSEKGVLDTVADTITDALSALFNPLPDREGPCPGGREVVDKFGRKRCVSDSGSTDGIEAPDSPRESVPGGSSGKGVFDTLADTVTDALSALLNPLPDREGPCPGGREVIDKFGRKRCVTDQESADGFEGPGTTSEGAGGSSGKGVFDTLADTVTDALSALLNPLPDREGPCPSGREVIDKFGRKRCVEDGADTEGPGIASESTGAGGSGKGFMESMVDSVTDALGALLNPMADRQGPCPGGSEIIDKFGRRRCVEDAASADDTKTDDPSASEAPRSTGAPEENPDPSDQPAGDQPGLFDDLGGKLKEVAGFLLNPLPDREEACKDGHLFVDKYGRKRCVSRASDDNRGSDEPGQPAEDSKNKPVAEGDYRTEDSTAMPDTGSDSDPKGDEESGVPVTGIQTAEAPSLFDKMKDSFGAAISFLLNPMPDREGPCGGGRQVVDRFGRKRCITSGR